MPWTVMRVLPVERGRVACGDRGGFRRLSRELAGLSRVNLPGKRCETRAPGHGVGNVIQVSLWTHVTHTPVVPGTAQSPRPAASRLCGLRRGLEYPTSWVSSRTPWPDPGPQRGR